MLANRPQPTDFHTLWLTLAMPTLPVQVLSKPHKAAATTKPDSDDPMIEELKSLKERRPDVHWERIVKKIKDTSIRRFYLRTCTSAEPQTASLIKRSTNRKPSTDEGCCSKVVNLLTDSDIKQLNEENTKQLGNVRQKGKKCRLCGCVNAGHDSRNCPKKHQYKTA